VLCSWGREGVRTILHRALIYRKFSGVAILGGGGNAAQKLAVKKEKREWITNGLENPSVWGFGFMPNRLKGKGVEGRVGKRG